MDRSACESSTSCCSEASDEAGVSNRCGTEEGGGIALDASLKCKTAELEEPGFDGDSEAGRRWFTTGLKNVPPFSVGGQGNT